MREQGPCNGERRHDDGMEKGANAVDVTAAIVLGSTFKENLKRSKIAVRCIASLLERALYGRFISTPSRRWTTPRSNMLRMVKAARLDSSIWPSSFAFIRAKGSPRLRREKVGHHQVCLSQHRPALFNHPFFFRQTHSTSAALCAQLNLPETHFS